MVCHHEIVNLVSQMCSFNTRPPEVEESFVKDAVPWIRRGFVFGPTRVECQDLRPCISASLPVFPEVVICNGGREIVELIPIIWGIGRSIQAFWYHL